MFSATESNAFEDLEPCMILAFTAVNILERWDDKNVFRKKFEFFET